MEKVRRKSCKTNLRHICCKHFRGVEMNISDKGFGENKGKKR